MKILLFLVIPFFVKSQLYEANKATVQLPNGGEYVTVRTVDFKGGVRFKNGQYVEFLTRDECTTLHFIKTKNYKDAFEFYFVESGFTQTLLVYKDLSSYVITRHNADHTEVKTIYQIKHGLNKIR